MTEGDWRDEAESAAWGGRGSSGSHADWVAEGQADEDPRHGGVRSTADPKLLQAADAAYQRYVRHLPPETDQDRQFYEGYAQADQQQWQLDQAEAAAELTQCSDYTLGGVDAIYAEREPDFTGWFGGGRDADPEVDSEPEMG